MLYNPSLKHYEAKQIIFPKPECSDLFAGSCIYIYKVAAIKVGHTRFLPILAHRAVNFGDIFMKIGMYVYFG